MTLKSIFACPFRFAFLLLPIAGWCLTALPVAATETVLADKLEEKLREPFHGDLDALIERGIIRVLIPFSKTGYFIDKGVQRGINADLMVEFSKHLDKKHGKKTADVKVFLVPTSHERLFTDLAQGRGDLALGYLTVTQDREKLAAFSIPLLKDAREVPVTADSVADFTSPHDLSGRTVYVHKSASYFQSLDALNRKLSGEDGKTVQVVSVDERLEEEDLLEMVAAGAVPAIIADQNKAKLWIDVLEGLKMHPQAAVRTDGEIAIAVRKKPPGLLKEVNDFARTVQEGTLLGNIIFKRYLKDADYLKALHKGSYDENLTEFHAVFEKYAAKYNFDWLLIAAQSFQESRFDPKARSRAGAVGLMQIKPSTATPPPVAIEGVASDPDKNVQAGVKYLRYLADRYFPDLAGDRAVQTFFALAAYNTNLHK
ncbi:MltF family protein [Roseibium marinum]|uniref:Membrane-bound lytic murein transglycosylase MltF n=1 Tax=Roseibium marinum TaxID=281252 RepID=A0A2S3UW58_9HYPH|nr:lytic transglycosylase F [Roseibium marinum]POF31699.1 membrane-bound lytic murein transglycosylase MltF [Roseibium marinum]